MPTRSSTRVETRPAVKSPQPVTVSVRRRASQFRPVNTIATDHRGGTMDQQKNWGSTGERCSSTRRRRITRKDTGRSSESINDQHQLREARYHHKHQRSSTRKQARPALTHARTGTNTSTHTHMPARAQTHTLTHTRVHTHSHTNTLTRAHTHAHIHAQARTHTHAHPPTPTPTPTRTRTRTRTRAHTSLLPPCSPHPLVSPVPFSFSLSLPPQPLAHTSSLINPPLPSPLLSPPLCPLLSPPHSLTYLPG